MSEPHPHPTSKARQDRRDREPYPARVPPGHPFTNQIAALDRELDAIWPFWRERRPFNHLEPDRLARVKYVLKRRELLHGGLWGAPRDWPVEVHFDARNPRKCYAHAIQPSVSGDTLDAVIPPPPEVAPWLTTATPAEASPSLASLAIRLRIPFDAVERGHAEWLAAGCPGDFAAYLTSRSATR